MSDPNTAADFDALTGVTSRHSATEESIKRLYTEWDDLTSRLEGA
jgi:hypothetical protein